MNNIQGIQYYSNIDPYIFLTGMAIYPFIFSKYNPKKILISAGYLNKDQLKYWKKWYIKGLGEYFYKNKLKHEIDLEIIPNSPKINTDNLELSNKILLLNGGGKDSCVSSELLHKSKLDFEWFTIGFSKSQEGIQSVSSCKVKNIILSYQKFYVPSNYTLYYGHKPFTLYTSSVAVLVAVLKRFKYIFLSNEKSSDFGNLKINNIEINHQWTKSLEFEKMYSNYLNNYVNPNITYSSILKPLYEIQITKIFSNFPKYHNYFVSCNKLGTKNWCKKCSKCAFIFLALYPFLSRNHVNNIFKEDMLNKPENLLLFEQLIGQKNNKPFECVGTIKENKIAMFLAINKNESKPHLLNNFKKTLKIKDSTTEIHNFLKQYDENNNIPSEMKYKLRYTTLLLLGIKSKSTVIEGFTNSQVKYHNDTFIFLNILLIIIILSLLYFKKNNCI